MMTTSSRRSFLHIAGAGSALAASGVFSAGALATPADMSQADMSQADMSQADMSQADMSQADMSQADMPQADMPQAGDGRYVRPVKFGLGGVPFGNECEGVSKDDAHKALEAAWTAGLRNDGGAAGLGVGFGEGGYATSIQNKARDSLFLCSKVGKIIGRAHV